MNRSSVRVLLAGTDARTRLHLRRILSIEPDISFVGHIRTGVALPDVLQHTQADILLFDLDSPCATARDTILAASGQKMRTVVLTNDNGFPATIRAARPVAVARPENLENESPQSSFGISLRKALLEFRPKSVEAPSETFATQRTSLLLRPELIAIGSSTGGPQALPEVLSGLSGKVKQPVIITQHMPAAFTRMLAVHLARYTKSTTAEAEHGMPLRPGHIYVAPGGKHLLVARQNDQLVCHLDDGPPEHFCKPAVDPMLRSVAATVGGRALAIILTGMGQDGLAGCRNLVEAGGAVLAQNEASSVVWGMPGAVAQAGLCRSVLPLNRIAEEIVLLAGVNQ